MSQSQQVVPHQQDDCEDCQKERAENNRLIDFYQRLHKIKAKVTEIKPQLTNHTAAYKTERVKLDKIAHQIQHPPNLATQVKQFDSKEMGYQLTCALLEREIRMKKQNEQLSRRIRQLKTVNETTQETIKKTNVRKIDSQMQSQPQTELNSSKLYSNDTNRYFEGKKSKSLFSDSLDSAMGDNNKSFWGTYQLSPLRSERSKEDNSRYSTPFGSTENKRKDVSTFSSFQQTGESVFSPSKLEEDKKKVENLNLWLYQYNAEQPFNNGKTKNNNKFKLNKYK